MAIKGLSRLVIAPGYEYDEASGKATYSDSPSVVEKMVSYSAEISNESSDDLYGDNAVAEHGPTLFSDGTLTISTTELTSDTSKLLLSVKEGEMTVDGKTVKTLTYDKDTSGKTVGAGLIEEHQHKDKDFFRAVVLPKVSFDIPASSAETRAGSISWQTPEISGKIMQSDEVSEDEVNAWKITIDCETEAQALAAINKYFTDRKKAA